MSDVMTFSKRTAAGLEEVLRTLLLDSENKVPAERLRIVGALADGHIIESGDNANGYYVRFADGTQICLVSQSNMYFDSDTGVSFITGLYRFMANITFPAAFVSVPSVSAAGAANGSSYAFSDVFLATSTGATLIHYTLAATLSTRRGTMAYIAIGKWK